MNRWPRLTACALICLSVCAPAQALNVVTFEDISPNDLADGYGGLAGWAGLGGVGIADRDQGGHGLKAFYGQDGMLSFLGAPVRVFGTLYRSYDPDPNVPPFAAVELWYRGQVVHSIADPQIGAGMAWLVTNYSGPVDAIHFQGGREGFSIDDLSYEALSSVPDPAAWMLLGSGLGLLAWRRRAAGGAGGGR